MRTSDQARPETLLAAVNTFLADMATLPPAVLAHEERLFRPPLLASAHSDIVNISLHFFLNGI